jgi:hypothetical protein
MEIIYQYSRAQAIDDGVLVDVSEMAKEAGIVFPTALTQAVWCKYVEVPPAVPWQDEKGRLWDILMMLLYAIRQSKDESILMFSVHIQNTEGPPTPVRLKAICGPGDDAEPVITILLPNED